MTNLLNIVTINVAMSLSQTAGEHVTMLCPLPPDSEASFDLTSESETQQQCILQERMNRLLTRTCEHALLEQVQKHDLAIHPCSQQSACGCLESSKECKGRQLH